jgi:hypothetical protein
MGMHQFQNLGMEQELAREGAFRWLSEFKPLLDDHEPVVEQELRTRLKTIRKLNDSSISVRNKLAAVALEEDASLLATLDSAIPQLRSIENSIQERLGIVTNRNVDLEQIQEKLAERKARQEIGLPVDGSHLPVCQKTGETNLAAVGGAGIFGLGWTAFTAVHCFFMVGGMWKAMGPVALFLLLFYSIFFGVGFMMLYAAYSALWNEDIEISGDQLVITRSFGKLTKVRRVELGPESRVVAESPFNNLNQSQNRPNQSTPLMIKDRNGKKVYFAHTLKGPARKQLADRANLHLQHHFSQ